MKNGDKHKDADAQTVYERMIEVFFDSKPVEGLNTIVHENFMGYGTAAHEFLGSLNDLINLAKTQADQLRDHPLKFTRKPIMNRFLNEASYLVVEEFHMHDRDNKYNYTARLSTILEKIDGKWLVTHFHGSTPDSNISEVEAFPMEGLRRKNLELEQKIKDRTRELEIETALEKVRTAAVGMKKHEDMLGVAESIYHELYELGFSNIRNAIIDIHNDDKRTFLDFDYSPELGKSITLMSYDDDPIIEKQIKQFESNQESFFEMILEGQELQDLINLRIKNGEKEDPRLLQHDQLTYNLYSFGNGEIGISNFGVLSDDQKLILRKFKNVFALSYKRYNDLVQAENQAREANIEVALERTRSQSMLMQHSAELNEISKTFHEQLLNLGIDSEFSFVWLPDESKQEHMFWATWADDASGELTLHNKAIVYPLDKTEPGTAACYAAWNSDEPVQETYVPAHDVAAFLSSWEELLRGAEKLRPEFFPDGIYYTEAFMKYGCFGIDIRRKLDADEKEIIRRFAVEFERTYTRFLDLKNAEAQAKEAQIELSLERIRAQVTAMQESSDLLDIVVTMRTEFVKLGHDAHYFWHMRWLRDKYEKAMTSGDGTRIGMVMTLPRHLHGDITLVSNWEKSNEPTAVLVMDVDTAVDYVDKMISLGDFEQVDPQAPTLDDIRHIGGLTFVMARTTHGEIGYSLPGTVPNPPKEAVDTLIRFAGVFDLAYKRFEDLKAAERQHREAQIELALERVRARSMAMQKSEELKEVIQVVYDQFAALNILIEHTGFIIDYKTNEDMHIWLADRFLSPFEISIPYFDSPHWNSFIEAKKNGEHFFANLLSFEEKNKFYSDLFVLVPGLPDESKKLIFSKPGLAISTVLFENIGLYIENFSGIPYTKKENDTLMRFGKVFQQTYTRFLDLQKSEAQAVEATKQASLDRVRGEISSMRNSDDLSRITPLVFNELTTLGIPFIRCGVFIVNDKEKSVEVYLSTPDGKSLAVMNLPFGANEMTIRAAAAWEQKEVFIQHWNQSDFINWGRSMQQHGYVKDLKTYQGEQAAPQSLHLHFVPFAQGLLYVGSTETLTGDQINLVKALARSFAVAYSRYEDFIKLELAKADVETAMSELKATQSQLIQQEKLASLGQLTAGIAHEIKNPLNFVNNFSDLNIELIDEIYEELKKLEGNSTITDILELLGDLRSNQNKIHQHGMRADGIVKSMLQHSRGGSGKVEPTDFNNLIREYVNLSFHGMRAGKKAINVTIDLQLDENVGIVPLISEDFSRVILNLCNNAFDSMREKFNSQTGREYNPKLTVKTLRTNGNVALQIKDNGGGIPEEYKDKILQPFFTTKKGTEGTGLGLSITNDIIKAHMGSLEIISEKDDYTSFNILLPTNI